MPTSIGSFVASLGCPYVGAELLVNELSITDGGWPGVRGGSGTDIGPPHFLIRNSNLHETYQQMAEKSLIRSKNL
jgi:hypothetical protein